MTAYGNGAIPALRRSFERARFEIIPIKGVEEQAEYLPDGAVVTVTSSPSKGLDATLELAERLLQRDLHVVPHIAARLVASPAHLQEILQRLADLKITEIFAIAGDANQPAGPFEGAAALLREMHEIGHRLDRIGIAGYPESHAFISDSTTIQAMSEKIPYADYIVSQICYDPAVTKGWIRAVRERGVNLPIYIGLPGAINRARLAQISMKVGLGDSIRFLTKQTGTVSKLLRGYLPDELVHELAPCLDDQDHRVHGWHLFTFNQVKQTERWRRQQTARGTAPFRRSPEPLVQRGHQPEAVDVGYAEFGWRAHVETQIAGDDTPDIRWERRSEWPLTGAAVLFLGAYAWPILDPNLDQTFEVLCEAVVWFTWALFAGDYLVRLALAPGRIRFVGRNLLDLAMIALPLLRPLRLLRLVTVLKALNRNAAAALREKIGRYVGASTGLLIFVTSLAMLDAERNAEGANIHTFEEALWWAFNTITTVGYGDLFPVTGTGRLVAVGLMIGGVALFGVVTATLAAWFVGITDAAKPESDPPA